MKSIFLLAALAMLGAAPAMAQELVLDDFSTGEFQGGQFDSFFQTYYNESDGDMVGGTRVVRTSNNDGFQVADGVFHYDSTLEYGQHTGYNQYYNPIPGVNIVYGNDGAWGSPALNMSTSGYDRFRLELPSVVQSYRIAIILTNFSAADDSVASLSKVVEASDGPVTHDFLLSDFFTQEDFDWNNIDRLHVDLRPLVFRDDLTVSVDRITLAVPEPETYALTALGLAAVAARLRRRT